MSSHFASLMQAHPRSVAEDDVVGRPHVCDGPTEHSVVEIPQVEDEPRLLSCDTLYELVDYQGEEEGAEGVALLHSQSSFSQ